MWSILKCLMSILLFPKCTIMGDSDYQEQGWVCSYLCILFWAECLAKLNLRSSSYLFKLSKWPSQEKMVASEHFQNTKTKTGWIIQCSKQVKCLFTWGEMLLNWYSANDNKIQILARNRTSLSSVHYILLRGNLSGKWCAIQSPYGHFPEDPGAFVSIWSDRKGHLVQSSLWYWQDQIQREK